MENDASPVDPARSRFTLSLHRFRQVAIVTVAGVCLLTVAGAVVRLTGSGLGCDDWPNCNSERFIDVSTGHAAIEQVNRLISGFIGIPTLVMAIGAFRVRPRRRGLVWPSLGVLVSILGNGVVGGMAVRGDLHPSLVQSHFVLAIASIGFGLIAVHRSGPQPVGDARSGGLTSWATALFWALGATVAAALVTGTVVTGAGPHAGDETARRYGFDISTVAEIHSITVWIAVAVFVALLIVLRMTPSVHRRMSSQLSTWMFVAVVQGGIGYVQYFTDVPSVLVAAHVAGATALWVVTMRLVLAGLEPVELGEQGVHGAETQREHEISFGATPTA
jgi:heme a synthase